MEKALSVEGEAAIEETIRQMVERSIAYCPKLELTPCQLESLRFYSQDDNGNYDALCNSCSEDLKPLTSALCTANSTSYRYPSNVFANKFNSGRSFEERACCSMEELPRVAGALTYDEIRDLKCKEGPPIGAIVGGVLGGLAGLILGIFALIYIRRKWCKKKPIVTTNEFGRSSAQERPTPPAPQEEEIHVKEAPASDGSPYNHYLASDTSNPPPTAPAWGEN
mmetsp:Transcript_3226/g.4882  ORF Transcript_3226/g.4882 Transcript_3226/m.4882 type:complete len:223 (+) Transcript_3226:206-874(+)